MEKNAWFVEFGFPEDLPQTKEALAQALFSGIVEEKAYFNWAMNYYSLPKIESQFFTSLGIIETFQVIQEIWDQWGPLCFPLAVWDGVLSIGCINPEALPDKIGPYTVSKLLASPYDLASLWKKVDPHFLLPSEIKDLDRTRGALSDLSLSALNNFEKSIIFKVENNFVYPLYFPSFSKTVFLPDKISTDTPSPFRIVTSTQKPFHGFIAKSDFNDTWIKTWFGTDLGPLHLTMVPVINSGKVEYLVAGLNSSHFNFEKEIALKNMIKIATTTESMIPKKGFFEDDPSERSA